MKQVKSALAEEVIKIDHTKAKSNCNLFECGRNDLSFGNLLRTDIAKIQSVHSIMASRAIDTHLGRSTPHMTGIEAYKR